MKTVMFIHHGASLGGAPLSLFETLKRIDKRRYNILVILPCAGPLCDLLDKENIKYKIIPLSIFYYCSLNKTFCARSLPGLFASLKNIFDLFINSTGNILCLGRIIKRYKPDVVVINSSTLLLSGVIARFFKVNVIWHIREVISTERSRVIKWFISSIINLCAKRVIVNSEFSRRDMADLGVRNTVLIYNGVDIKRFQHGPRSGSGGKTAAFMGMVYKEKGWRSLVNAAFLLTNDLPDAKFIVIGNTRMMARSAGSPAAPLKGRTEDLIFQKVAEDMGLKDAFSFLGQRFDVENILPLADCLVFPSEVPETFGRSMIEAMACGLPVIAFNTGAAGEVIVDNVTGLLVEPGNHRQLYSALKFILTNEEAAVRMGLAGRRRVEELFDIEKITPRLFKIYGLS